MRAALGSARGFRRPQGGNMPTSWFRRASRVLVPVATAVLIGATAPGALANAAPAARTTSGASAPVQSVRSIVRRASLSSLKDGVPQLPRGGTKGPEVPPGG